MQFERNSEFKSWRLSGNFLIEEDHRIVLVTEIGHRKEVYEDQ